jgi:RimJ/RimL family protein N-acetyltransferase
MDIAIRRIRPADVEELSRFYNDLSPMSLWARFLGYTRGLSGSTTRALCALDHMHDEGLVAVVGDPDSPRIVGHVCLADAGAGAAEIGICVADDFQGQGVGRRLFEQATAWAIERGFKSIVASCFVNNARVLALLGSAPYGARTTFADDGVVDVTIPLEPPLPVEAALAPVWSQAMTRRSRRRAAITHDQPFHAFWLARRPRSAQPTKATAGRSRRV